MNSGILGFLVVVFWAIPALAAVFLGLEKGRGLAGLAYGVLFGVFGLLVTAMLDPSDSVRRDRNADLAKEIALAMSSQQRDSEAVTRDCPNCLSPISRRASVCRACGRDVEPIAVSDQSVASMNSRVGVLVTGCAGATDDGSELLMVVEPGWLTFNACSDDCEVVEHDLIVDAGTALALSEAVRSVSVSQRPAEVRLNNGDKVLLDWLASPDDSSMLSVDWSGQFLSRADRRSHAAGEEVAFAYHGVILLAGDLADSTSEVAIFENALTIGADLANAWRAGRVTQDSTVVALSAIGTIAD